MRKVEGKMQREEIRDARKRLGYVSSDRSQSGKVSVSTLAILRCASLYCPCTVKITPLAAEWLHC